MDDGKSGGGAHRVLSIGSPHSLTNQSLREPLTASQCSFLSCLACDAVWVVLDVTPETAGTLTAQCPRIVGSHEMGWAGLSHAVGGAVCLTNPATRASPIWAFVARA